MIAAFFFLLAPPAQARIVILDKGRAQLQFNDDAKKIALSDTVRIDLVVDGTPDLVVDMPAEMPADAKWTLVERHPVHKETFGANQMRWSVNCFFAPREPGPKVEFVFPAIKIKDRKIEETITFAPIFYEVTTQIKEADIKQLRDITSIEPLPPIEPVDRTWLWWLGAGVGSALAVVLAFVILRFVRKKSITSPEELALHELSRLVKLELPAQGKSERFITLLTTLVRQYLERQFGLPARRRTTPEFLAQLDAVVALTTDEKQFLRAFLERCEAVKFANVGMSSEECTQWWAQARQFFERRAKPG